MMKKDKKNLKGKVNGNDEVSKLIKIIISVVVIYLGFFILTKVSIDKKIKDNKEKEDLIEAEIQFEEIILGNLLEQKESEYYVLVTFEDDVYNPLYNNYFISYLGKENALQKYNVNINNAFNKKHITDKTDSDIENLMFKETTLLKIKYKKIHKIYEGREKIIEHLKKLID